MLQCKIDLKNISDNELICVECTICKARSKLIYPFDKDLKTSDDLVNSIKEYIERNSIYSCVKTVIYKKPDLSVIDVKQDDKLICRIESKLLEGFAFMKSEYLLKAKLKPKETLVVDKPKLLSYFECEQQDWIQHKRYIPIFVVWKFDRPCKDFGGITIFQEVKKLKMIYDSYRDDRAFERQTVNTDFRNGKKMGITAKYHFSIKECRPIEELIPTILNL